MHFDAHPDLYDHLDGDRFSHACPFARIMEEGRAARLLQFGIRTMNPHQRAQAERFGVEVHEFRDWDGVIPPLAGPVYVTVDLDALDPALRRASRTTSRAGCRLVSCSIRSARSATAVPR